MNEIAIDENAEQRDGEGQAIGQRVILIGLRPKAQLVDQKRHSEDDRLAGESRLENFQERRQALREECRDRAGERRAGEKEHHRIRRVKPDQKCRHGEGADSKAEKSHRKGPRTLGERPGGG